MNDPRPLPPVSEPKVWKTQGTSRVPFWLYTDEEIYQRELERLFYGPHWSYVGLSCEIPNAGDFKRTWIGERNVLMVRDENGAVNVIENRCAHRGVQFCREATGNRKEFVCPYHQWNYDLKGNLLGVPYMRGIKGKGGMPADFKRDEHGLRKLGVTERNGVVFASFDPEVEDFETFLGPTMLKYFDRVFNGRKLTVLGYNRQRVPGNWKLIHENLKDCYHPGLLHTWFVNFGLWRADNECENVMDEQRRHSAMVTVRNQGGKGEATAGVASFREDLKLNYGRFLDVEDETWWNGPSAVIQSLFPSLIIQQQINSVAMRQVIPRGPRNFDYIWTHIGFEEDTADMTQRRLYQANLFGPAGFVSGDDSEVMGMVQDNMHTDKDGLHLVQLGGRDVEDTDTHVSETLIRGMYHYYRKVMEI